MNHTLVNKDNKTKAITGNSWQRKKLKQKLMQKPVSLFTFFSSSKSATVRKKTKQTHNIHKQDIVKKIKIHVVKY